MNNIMYTYLFVYVFFSLVSRRNRTELDFLVGFLTTSYYISNANACYTVDQTGYTIYIYIIYYNIILHIIIYKY